jgi:RimJ/RimL family protein N-acetyltransferase
VSASLAPDAPRPVLRAERLVLRPFELRDAADVQRLAGAREVADTTLTIPHPYPDGAAEQWISMHPGAWASRQTATYAIVDAATDALLGATGLILSMENRRAELGYWVGVPFWNQGYCTEAARVLLDFGFDVLGLHRIEARHMTRNPASGRVMQKLGMTLEGVHRDVFYRRDTFETVAMYAVLRDEWLAIRRAEAST